MAPHEEAPSGPATEEVLGQIDGELRRLSHTHTHLPEVADLHHRIRTRLATV